jgi:peptidoglycan/xylan/chitin deacetylase (PgdA/CDA1 family)
MSETPGVRPVSAKKLVARAMRLGIAVACWSYDLVCLQISRFAGSRWAGTCTILYYHSIPDKYKQRFARQMALLTRLAIPVDVRSIPDLTAGSRYVAVTFDDALESFFQSGVPVLAELRIPATVFAVVDALGDRPTWASSYYTPDERVMSADQLRSLPKLITVASHTLTHADLATAPPEQAEIEIGTSRKKLEALLGQPVTLFSFPFGTFNDAALEICARAGYKAVFTTEPVDALAKRTEFAVGRVAADPWDSYWEFRLKIAGAYRWDSYFRRSIKMLRSVLARDNRRMTETMKTSSSVHEASD